MPTPYLSVADFRTRTIVPPADVDRVQGLSYGEIDTVGVLNVIIGATNASPIVCETGAAHGMNTGDTATVDGVTGNTTANVTATITVVDSTHFSLDGTSGNGAYTGGGTCESIGSSPISASPALPSGVFPIAVRFMSAGTVGITGITYEYSTDGGITFSGSQALGTATAITIPGTGASFLLGAGTIEAGQTFACSVQPDFITTELSDWTSYMDSRLRKRYAIPFIEPVPFAVKKWLTDIVSKRVYERRGYNTSSAQDANAVQAPYDQAIAEIKEAADSNTGLFDLPLRDDLPGQSGIARGGPFAYSEQSPYVNADRQESIGRQEDANGTGSGDQ